MGRTLCIFLGDAAAPNIQRVIGNWGKMLGEKYDLHLVTTTKSSFSSESLSQYEIFGNSFSNSLIGSIRALAEYLKTENPGVVAQVTRPPIHGAVVGILSSVYDVPAVYRYAGDRFYEYKVTTGINQGTKFLLNNIFGRASIGLFDKHIAFGPRGRNQLTSRGISPSRISVLPPAIDPQRFEINDEEFKAFPKDKVTMLFLGRPTQLKGIETLERTLPEIFDTRPELHLVLLGSDSHNLSLSPRYLNKIDALGLVPPATVPRYLQEADVLIHPSLTEGIPRAVLEALYMKTPVVARATGDVEVITENTFETESEFKSMLMSYESLPVDDVSPFTVDALSDKYIDFFGEFLSIRN